MILIITTCKEKMHELEFVKPVVDVVKECGEKYSIMKYDKFTSKDVDKTDKIIICGTSLRDFDFENHIDKFEFIKTTNKPILGICAGFQIICQVFGCRSVKGEEIGLIECDFKEFLSIRDKREIYALHNNAIKDDTTFKKHFDVFAKTKYVQAIKHKSKPIYGTLFHPEVRNKGLIRQFLEST